MQLEIGTILEGTVTRVAAFGAFVALPDRKSGMVHISELSDMYIRDINEAVRVGDRLRVKVISVDERGRISLSVRQAQDKPEGQARPECQVKPDRQGGRSAGEQTARRYHHAARTQNPVEYQPPKRTSDGTGSGDDSFEEMMARFKRVSDEKISDLNKYTQSRGGAAGKGSGAKRKR